MSGTVAEIEALAVAQVDLINRVARLLRRSRKTAGFTQGEMAEKLGVSQPRIAQIESGKPSDAASLEQISAYAFHCKKSVDIFIHQQHEEKVETAQQQSHAA